MSQDNNNVNRRGPPQAHPNFSRMHRRPSDQDDQHSRNPAHNLEQHERNASERGVLVLPNRPHIIEQMLPTPPETSAQPSVTTASGQTSSWGPHDKTPRPPHQNTLIHEEMFPRRRFIGSGDTVESISSSLFSNSTVAGSSAGHRPPGEEEYPGNSALRMAQLPDVARMERTRFYERASFERQPPPQYTPTPSYTSAEASSTARLSTQQSLDSQPDPTMHHQGNQQGKQPQRDDSDNDSISSEVKAHLKRNAFALEAWKNAARADTLGKLNHSGSVNAVSKLHQDWTNHFARARHGVEAEKSDPQGSRDPSHRHRDDANDTKHPGQHSKSHSPSTDQVNLKNRAKDSETHAGGGGREAAKVSNLKSRRPGKQSRPGAGPSGDSQAGPSTSR